MTEMNERLLTEVVDGVKELLRKEQSDRLRDVYLIGDIEKDTAKIVIERLRELVNDDKAKPARAKEYGLIDDILGPMDVVLPEPADVMATSGTELMDSPDIAAAERPADS